MNGLKTALLACAMTPLWTLSSLPVLAADGAGPMVVAQAAECPPGDEACLKARPGKPKPPQGEMNPPGAPQGEAPTKPAKPKPPQGEMNPPGAPQGEAPMKPAKPRPPQGEINPPGAPQSEAPMKPAKPKPPQGEMNPPGQPPQGEMPMKPGKPMPPQGETNPPGQPPQGEMPMKPGKPVPPQGEMTPPDQPPQGEMPMKPGKPVPPQGEVNPPPQAPDAPRTGEFVPPRPMGPMPELPQHDPALDAAMQNSDNQRANSIADVQRDRRTIRGADGSQMIVEPGGRVIIVNGDTAIIRHNDYDRLDTGARNVESRPTADGGRVVVVYRPDGARIRTVYDRWGGVLQRTREDPDGRSYVLFDNRLPPPGAVADYPNGPMGQPVVVLPPPVYDLPPEQYRVDLRTAPPAYVVDALTAPPIAPVEPRYTLNQVIYSPDLRARVRSVDLDTITFDTGSWTVDQSQAATIETVANGIHTALSRNANEVFLVEGYTDAVGSAVDNLSLSDRRAEAVAGLLTQYYQIPPENLVTQGYGESQLKVQTQYSERANRRVVVRRITPLLATRAPQ